jgi:TolB-like protein/Tfp pilus assembly protein PilF
MNISNFIQELKRRNVFKVAAAYAIAGWLIIQIAATVFPAFEFPGWTTQFVIILVGIGFPLAIIFAWAFELTPDGLKKSKEVEITESVTNRTGKKLNGIIIGVLSIALFFVVVERVFFAKSSILENQQTEFETASIAVLPFVNMSGDEQNEYFSDGLSEELLNALAKVEDMKVAGRTSSFKFKGQNEDLKLVGEQLGVGHLLEGSVRKSGGRVRITAQLIKVDDGFHMWSETFDRELTADNIFDIQEEISITVMEVLKVKLLPEEEIAITTRPTNDIEAYNAFLEANQLLLSLQPDDTREAIEKYEQAIRIDPTFAEAYARLAIAYVNLNQFGNFSLDEAKVVVRENIDKALLLNGNLGRAYEALGYYNLMIYEEKGALESFERAVELMPNDPDVYNGLHLALEYNDRYDEANDKLGIAYEKDPLNPGYAASYANHLVNHDANFEEASVIFDKMLSVYPEYAPTYRYKAQMLSEAPFGKMDEAFEYVYEAYLKNNDDLVIMRVLFNLSKFMDHLPLAKFFEQRIEELYPDNDQRFWIHAQMSTEENNFVKTEEILKQAMQNIGEQSSDDISGYLAYVYYQQEKYSEAVEILEKQFPELMEQPLTVDDTNNNQATIYLSSLDKVGRMEEFAVLKEAYCGFVESNIAKSTNIRDTTWARWGLVSCNVYNEEVEKAIELMEELYFEKNSKTEMSSYLKHGVELQKLQANPKFKALKDRIFEDLHNQRANVIDYLKAKGDWKEEWEVSE